MCLVWLYIIKNLKGDDVVVLMNVFVCIYFCKDYFYMYMCCVLNLVWYIKNKEILKKKKIIYVILK